MTSHLLVGTDFIGGRPMTPVRTVRSVHDAVVSILDRAPALIVLVASFVTGAALGVFARVWMRFITNDQEFSWEGTLLIVIGFGVVFLGQAGVYLARRNDVRQTGFVAARILAIVTLLPMATAAGAFAFPIIVLAPLAIVRTGWNRWLRLVLGLLALITGVFIASIVISALSTVRATIGVIWFVVIYGLLVWAVSFSFASRHDQRFTHVAAATSTHQATPFPERT